MDLLKKFGLIKQTPTDVLQQEMLVAHPAVSEESKTKIIDALNKGADPNSSFTGYKKHPTQMMFSEAVSSVAGGKKNGKEFETTAFDLFIRSTHQFFMNTRIPSKDEKKRILETLDKFIEKGADVHTKKASGQAMTKAFLISFSDPEILSRMVKSPTFKPDKLDHAFYSAIGYKLDQEVFRETSDTSPSKKKLKETLDVLEKAIPNFKDKLQDSHKAQGDYRMPDRIRIYYQRQ